MKHIIKIEQTPSGWFDVKYRRKWYRYKTHKEAKDKADNILIYLFFNGIPLNQIEYEPIRS